MRPKSNRKRTVEAKLKKIRRRRKKKRHVIVHCDCGDQVCLKWEADDAADDDMDGFQLMVDGEPVGEPMYKSLRQVNIHELKPGQELDVALLPLDDSRQPLTASNVVKARHAFFSCRFKLLGLCVI